jgi:hypothetical protein
VPDTLGLTVGEVDGLPEVEAEPLGESVPDPDEEGDSVLEALTKGE